MLMIFRVYLFLFFPDFLIFHNTVMIYNARNQSNDTAESQKEKKDVFQRSFSVQPVKNHGIK